MLNKISTYLKKESPRGVLSNNTSRISVVVITSVFSILLFFKPFGIDDFKPLVQWYLIIGFTACSFIGYSTIITIFSPQSKNSWTNLHEITTLIFSFLLIAVLIYGYTLFLFTLFFPKVLEIETLDLDVTSIFLKILFYTFCIGFIIYRGSKMYEMLHMYKNQSQALNFDNPTLFSKRNNSLLNLLGKNKNERLTLMTNDLICIKSEGHYIRVYYLGEKNNEVKHSILRSTMTEIERQTADYSYIYRCHKSFFINFNYIKSIIGNSNKAHAYLEHYAHKVPVSKSKIAYMKSRRLREKSES